MLSPQKGAQTKFLASRANITIYGGAAGGGKTYALLLEPLRFFHLSNINAAIIRRERAHLMMPGSVWSESQKIYADIGFEPNLTNLEYTFGHGKSKLKFAGVQYENDVNKWQGAQLDFLGFDELTQFTEYQFWYLIGRLRSTSGKIRPYCRATCNPGKGWVFDLIKWWIDDKTLYPISERSGKLRWLIRLNDINHWFNGENDAIIYLRAHKIDDKIKPMSISFIPATLNDNQILIKNDPSYYAKLAQLPEDEREKLLFGRWLFTPKGNLFRTEWFKNFVIEPRDPEVILITTDTASSTKSANDYTVFQTWARKDGVIYLIDQLRGKYTANEQLTLLVNLIINKKARYVSIERASTGFHLINEIVRKTGVILLEMTRNKDKYTRAYEVQEFVERGYVFVNPESSYYSDFVAEHCAFAPENKNKYNFYDDQVDCTIDAIKHLIIDKIGYNTDEQLVIPRYITGYKQDIHRRM